MNLSLRNRVAFSFIIANIVVLLITFTVFQFLNTLNKEVEQKATDQNRISFLNFEIRISTINILKNQRDMMVKGVNEPVVKKLTESTELLKVQLQRLDGLQSDPAIKSNIAKMLSYIDSLNLLMAKSVYSRDKLGVISAGEISDKILDTFNDLQENYNLQLTNNEKSLKETINQIKQKMMITLIIGFLGTIVLGLVVPGKIALPFKKIKDAIRELQDCNLDVSIYYNQDDEIGEIAKEMNKMIHSFKVFDELRTDRISVENRKFDALANMTKRPVLVANAEQELIYMNNKMYSILQVQSDDVLGKEMQETSMPSSIKEAFELAIKRRSKIENTEIKIVSKNDVDATNDAGQGAESMQINESGDSVSGEDSAGEVIFNGYANVIPVRGKDSSLDYYLMVLSTEVFV